MNSFKKILLTTAFITSSFGFSQQSIDVTNLPATYNELLEFRGNWAIKNDQSNDSFIINGSQIMNSSNYRSNDLELKVYFAPIDKNDLSVNKYAIQNLPNLLNKETKLGSIDGNRNSFNNVRISFTQNEIKYLTPGLYKAIVVLKDQKTGDIRNYKILDDKLEYTSNKFELIEDKDYMLNGEVADNTLSNIYSTVRSSLSLAYAPNQLVLAGDWKLDVDFATLTANISGEGHGIKNMTSSPSNKLKLLIYFAEDKPEEAKTVEGYELLNVDINPIGASKMLNKPVIKTNITRNIPRGDYYPVLVLTEADSEGNYKVKSAIRFKDKYTL